MSVFTWGANVKDSKPVPDPISRTSRTSSVISRESVRVLCSEVGGVTFVTTIFESGRVALDSVEGFLSTLYVLFVVVPFCGFFSEARVVDVLVCHRLDRLAESSLCTRSSMVQGLDVRHGGGCGVESANLCLVTSV
jgi:hypothetical protein